MHNERRRHHVAQKAEAGDDRAECDRLRHDVEELDLDHVAGLGALDEYRAGQRMDAAGIEVRQVGDSGVRTDLAVDGVARFENDFVALGHFRDRRDVRMIAVVTAVRLGGERLGPVDANGVLVHAGPL